MISEPQAHPPTATYIGAQTGSVRIMTQPPLSQACGLPLSCRIPVGLGNRARSPMRSTSPAPSGIERAASAPNGPRQVPMERKLHPASSSSTTSTWTHPVQSGSNVDARSGTPLLPKDDQQHLPLDPSRIRVAQRTSTPQPPPTTTMGIEPVARNPNQQTIANVIQRPPNVSDSLSIRTTASAREVSPSLGGFDFTRHLRMSSPMRHTTVPLTGSVQVPLTSSVHAPLTGSVQVPLSFPSGSRYPVPAAQTSGPTRSPKLDASRRLAL